MSIQYAKRLARAAGLPVPAPRIDSESALGFRAIADRLFTDERAEKRERHLYEEFSKRRKKRYAQIQKGIMAHNDGWPPHQVAYTWRSPEGKVFSSWMHRRKFRFATPKAIWGFLKGKYPGLHPTPVGMTESVRLQVGNKIDMDTGEVVGLGYKVFPIWDWVLAPQIPKWQYAAEAAYVQRGAWPDTEELKAAYTAHLKGDITEIEFSERVRRILANADVDLDPVEASFNEAWEHLEDRPGKEHTTLEAREAEFHNNPIREHLEVENLLSRNFSKLENLENFLQFVEDNPPRLKRAAKAVPVDLSDLL